MSTTKSYDPNYDPTSRHSFGWQISVWDNGGGRFPPGGSRQEYYFWTSLGSKKCLFSCCGKNSAVSGRCFTSRQCLFFGRNVSEIARRRK